MDPWMIYTVPSVGRRTNLASRILNAVTRNVSKASVGNPDALATMKMVDQITETAAVTRGVSKTCGEIHGVVDVLGITSIATVTTSVVVT